MAFENFKAWIARRREEIAEELDVLDALETERSLVFKQAVSRVQDRAVEIAKVFTRGEVLRSELGERIEDLLLGSVPAGLPDDSPVTGTEPIRLFLSEALVFLGLALKARPSEVVNGLLFLPTSGFLDVLTGVESRLASMLSVLQELVGQAVGQGSLLPPNDPRIASLVLDLKEAAEGSDRLLANITGTQPITPALAARVTSFLRAGIDDLSQGTPDLHRLVTLTTSLRRAGEEVLSSAQQVHTLRRNLLAFRSQFEGQFTALAADRAQAASLSANINALLGVVEAAQGALEDLSPLRESWLKELSALHAIAEESQGALAAGIFTADQTLGATYDAFKAQLEQVPETDFVRFESNLATLQGLLTGSRAAAGFQEQYDLLLASETARVTLFRDRVRAIRAALEAHPFPSSDLITQILSTVKNSRMTEAEDSLTTGDLSTFFQLAVGTLNVTDRIKGEIREFIESGAGTGTSVGDSLSEGFLAALEFESDDIQAERSFEEARTLTILGLRSDLSRLDRLESLIERAEELLTP